MSLTLTGVGLNTAAGGDTIIMPYYEHHPAWSSYDASSNYTYTRYQGAVYIGGGEAYDSGAFADGDSISWYVNLAAGTYSYTMLVETAPSFGIVDCSLDASVFLSADFYSAGGAKNVNKSASGIVVAADGNYTLKLQANGKNASSSSYGFYPQWFSFLRTGA